MIKERDREQDDRASEAYEFEFGDWLVQPSLDLVSRGAEQHKLERKAMDVLVFLLERPGEVVSIQDLLQHVWAGRVVEENSVHRRISQLRKALADDAHNPRFIASVPRRGYLTVAPVIRPHLSDSAPESSSDRSFGDRDAYPAAASQAPAMALSMAQISTPLQRIVQLHQRLLFCEKAADKVTDYLLLSVCGLVPVGTAVFLQVSSPSVDGYWSVLLLPVLLPLWLYTARQLFRMCLGRTRAAPLAGHPAYALIRKEVDIALSDWRPVMIALFLSLLLIVANQTQTVAIPGMARTAAEAPLLHDSALFASQFLFTHLILVTGLYMYLFNKAYRRGIYVRSRVAPQQQAFVLNFDDGNRRFGLHGLARIFAAQILVCFFAGGMLMLYRYLSVDLDAAQSGAAAISCRLGVTQDACVTGLPPGWLPEPAQLVWAGLWLGYFVTILWSINTKLLPFRPGISGAGVVAYLREFVPGGVQSQSQNDLAWSSELARKFSAQEHTPVGDSRVTDALRLAAFMFLLMLYPVVPTTLPQIVVLGLYAGAAVLAAYCFQMLQRHLLLRIDSSLA